MNPDISIHALREEGDKAADGVCDDRDIFLSTPSARRATCIREGRDFIGIISIHALREEGDKSSGKICEKTTDFYPRPPRGGRHKATRIRGLFHYFYPRPPRGGRLRVSRVRARVL